MHGGEPCALPKFITQDRDLSLWEKHIGHAKDAERKKRQHAQSYIKQTTANDLAAGTRKRGRIHDEKKKD
jgi:hypothetical protein